MEDDFDGTFAERLAQDRQALSSVLRTMEGRRFIRRLLEEAGLYEFAPDGLAPQSVLYKAAQRDFGLSIIAMVNDVDPRAFANLTREAAEDAVREAAKDKGGPR
jgi:CRP-like cAMP-binding protein